MERIGIVYFNNIECGIIKEIEGSFIFSYKKEYLNSENPIAISLTMPLTEEEYHSNVLFPFFDGLIPEGYLLDLAFRKYGIDKKDRMSLLLTVCEDTIGAVSVKGVQSWGVCVATRKLLVMM